MNATTTRAVTLLGLLLVLGTANYAIWGKERIIRNGETIYLDLAPVDPRSLMQGDYMALRFRLATSIETARSESSSERSAPLTLDERRVATLDSTGNGALRIAYRIRSGHVWLGTNAFFFAEGTADRYAAARYGEFKLDRASGEAVLVGLRDENLKAL